MGIIETRKGNHFSKMIKLENDNGVRIIMEVYS